MVNCTDRRGSFRSSWMPSQHRYKPAVDQFNIATDTRDNVRPLAAQTRLTSHNTTTTTTTTSCLSHNCTVTVTRHRAIASQQLRYEHSHWTQLTAEADSHRRIVSCYSVSASGARILSFSSTIILEFRLATRNIRRNAMSMHFTANSAVRLLSTGHSKGGGAG